MSDSWDAASELEFATYFPLHASCKTGNLEMLQRSLESHYEHLLLEDPVNNWTPSHWAAYCGQMDCLTIINRNESLFDCLLARSLQTPLHLACFAGQFMTAKWLLQRGAVVGKQDYMGETPLHKAARNGSLDCVRLLLSQGANAGVRNHSGLTPLDLAQQHNHRACSEALGNNDCPTFASSIAPVQSQAQKRCHDNQCQQGEALAKKPRCGSDCRTENELSTAAAVFGAVPPAVSAASVAPLAVHTYRQVNSFFSGWHYM